MSVDTRTPRTPTGDRSSGIDDAPALSMVKVPSDPAQVIVNHASFRVRLGASAGRTTSARITRHLSATQDTARIPVAGAPEHAGAPAAPARRRAVVWSGRSDPDDSGAHRLLQAVRAGAAPADAGATQVIERVDGSGPPGEEYDNPTTQTIPTPVVGAQRTRGGRTGSPPSGGGTRLLPAMRTVGSAYDEPAFQPPPYADDFEDFDDGYDGYGDGADAAGPRADDPARHAYYPGRRMNLGVVLLPLRVFLGFISVYAGMGKLCDPVYFDGGERGSMVKWLNTLHPWEVAEPLRQFALAHPVGSGLVIAFLQVIVGVLTVLGCWQRVCAAVGAFLSAALLLTVSWKSVPVYDAPDIIYLAAWSPLIIAGAPVYSVDGRLAGGAWRRLGPRADIWDLRRYVLRRGAVITFLVAGVTLLVGSLLGGAVRDADRVVVPGPGEGPRNELPGSALPEEPGERRQDGSPEATAGSPTQGATSGTTTGPDGTPSAPGAARETGSAATGGAPSQTQGVTGGQAPPQQSAPAGQAPPSTSAGPAGGGATTGGAGAATGGAGSDSGAGTGTDTGGGGDGGATSPGRPGLVGGLLG